LNEPYVLLRWETLIMGLSLCQPGPSSLRV
jgi:hypothetical protein